MKITQMQRYNEDAKKEGRNEERVIPCNWLLGTNISEQHASSPFMAYHSSVLKMVVDCVWNMTAHGNAWEGKWRGNWRMEWVASTLHTSSEHGVYSITTADEHTLAASSWLNWHPPTDLNGLVRFAERRNLISARAITFQLACTTFIKNTGTYQSNHMVITSHVTVTCIVPTWQPLTC